MFRRIVQLSVISLVYFCLFIFISMALANQIDQYGQSVPDDFEEKIQLARSYRMPYSGKYNPQQAIKVIKNMIEAFPEYYRGYFNLGLSYAEIKDYISAENSFVKALDIKNKNGITDTTIYNSAGWVCMNAGNFSCALSYFEKAIVDNKDNQSYTTKAAYNNIGQLYFNNQKFAEAKKYLLVARDKFGSSAAAETLKLINEIEKSKVTSP